MTSNKTDKYDVIYLCDNNLHEFIGGSEQSVMILLDGLSREYELAVIQPGQGKEEHEHSYDEFNNSSYIYAKALFRHPIAFFRYIVFCRKILCSNSAKIVHIQAHLSFFIVGFLLRLRLIKKDFALIYTDRGLYTKYNKLFRWLFIHYMKYMDILVTTTEFNQKYWRNAITKKYPGKSVNYVVIANTAGSDYEDCAEKYSFNEEKKQPFTIGFAGRYCSWKNWPLAEEIIIGVHKRDENIDFRINIACNDNAEINIVEEMIERLYALCGDCFEGKINVPHEEMKSFYEEIDAFILTSNKDTESFGRTLVEAMSCGTAVLITDAGGATEVVGSKEYICAESDEFVEKVLDLKNNPIKLKKIKNDNISRVQTEYSLDSNIVKHRNVYDGILG